MMEIITAEDVPLWPNPLSPASSAAHFILNSKESLRAAFERTCHYYLEDHILDRVWLALKLGKPLLVEGEAGCGKTELARSLARVLSTELVRVTCGEHTCIGDLFFRYDRELREAYLKANSRKPKDELIRDVRSEDFIIPGALLRAIRKERPSVALIDELDKAPVAVDNALLEWLEEFRISDSLLGTFEPMTKPYVVITSNNTRPLAEQLRDRCVFLFFDYYTPEREAEIIRTKGGVDAVLASQVAYLCRAFREIGFKAPPSIREALDIIEACKLLGIKRLEEESIRMLMNLAVKRRDDLRRAEKNLAVLHARAVEIATEYTERTERLGRIN